MMEKRNKGWRRLQENRVFKARLVYYAAFDVLAFDDERPMHWFELAKLKEWKIYKSTGTPCSCWMCRGEVYDRRQFKKDTNRIIKESEE